MVITDVNQVTYNGDGTTTAFPFTFKIIDASNIKLILIAENGLQTEITSDYYVDVENNTVYYPGYAPGSEPPEADQPAKLQVGEKLEIYRWIPINQLADLGEKWPFAVIEAGLDKLTMLLQDIYGWVGRNLINKVTGGTAWDADNLPISNVGGPMDLADAATKDYVDKILTSVIAGGEGRVIPCDTVAHMKGADLVAGQVAFTLGYYDISDGGAAVYNIRAAGLSETDDGGSIIILDNGLVAELISDGTVNVKQFGAYGDNVHDDVISIQNGIDYIASIGGGTVFLPKGQYKITQTVNVNDSNIKLVGEGKYLSVFRPTTDLIIDVPNLLVDWSVYVKNNNPTISTTIASAIAYRSNSITVADATGIEAGMLVYIVGDFSTSPWTSNNRGSAVKGETNKVVSVNGTTVTLATPTSEAFATTETVTVTFIKPLVGIVIQKIGISCPDDCAEDERDYRGFSVWGCDGARIDDCYGNGCGFSCIESMRSFKTKMENNVVTSAWTYEPNTSNILGLGYGLRCTDDNCSEIVNNQAEECRHCVDISGGYPSHNILVANNVFTSNVLDYGTVSTHGPAENCVIENNIIQGGTSVLIRGENNYIRNNVLKGGIRNYYGRNNSYEDNVVYGGMSFYQEDTLADSNYMIIKNNVFYPTGINVVYLNLTESRPFATANGWVVENNLTVILSSVSSTSTARFFNVADSGIAVVSFQKGLVFRNNLTRSQKANSIAPTLFTANMSNVTLGSKYDPVITDEEVINALPSTPFKGMRAFIGSMNKPAWYNGSKWVDADGRLATESASSAPSTGTYEEGDIVYNSSPTAGGYLGWICVSAGTPGTWKGFGAIEA